MRFSHLFFSRKQSCILYSTFVRLHTWNRCLLFAPSVLRPKHWCALYMIECITLQFLEFGFYSTANPTVPWKQEQIDLRKLSSQRTPIWSTHLNPLHCLVFEPQATKDAAQCPKIRRQTRKLALLRQKIERNRKIWSRIIEEKFLKFQMHQTCVKKAIHENLR